MTPPLSNNNNRMASSAATRPLQQQQATNDNNNDAPSTTDSSVRRHLFEMMLAGVATVAVVPPVAPAHAKLIQFPCAEGLGNTYHFMRAGESLLEADNLLGTNPLFLTNRENGLSPLGIEQAHAAAKQMEDANINPSVVKFSLAANSMDTSDIVGADLHVGRNRMVPEYTYMDQRGVGKWDMMELQQTQEAVWAMDVQEAGAQGRDVHPPSHDDGTANESLYNQVTRLVQLLSLLETFQSGDEILLIFPDGTGPALLSALIAGMPLDRVHEIHYQPGELRSNISYDSVRAAWPAVPSAEYKAAISRGKEHLANLRQNEQDVQLATASAESARVALKESKATERLAAQRASIESKRAEAAAAISNPVGDMIMPLAALGVVAGFVAFKDDGATNGEEVLAADVVAKGEDELGEAESTETKEVSGHSFPELRKLEELSKANPIQIPALNQQTATPHSGMNDSPMPWLNENGDDTPSPMAELEAKVAAAPIVIPEMPTKEERMQAMDEYIESVGGGDAWLGALSDMIDEE
eukprot:CAMPEP_0119003744 /NCGR_PEP_ID=MMETSP1176-20130426/742_1 /TAXON_ID=265551 /ORGANISM="Synedropsis recta cf, Strain CCMP1620" /LENGTH=525 /DNA_ID=CAMNT_0006955369 /DNA_START=122 /DNA_END=1699 /DNA_ORIENTATION=-